MKRKSIGRESGCDLVIENPSVALHHAWAELSADGSIYVSSSQTDNVITLLRNDRRIRVQRACLCVGDQLSFGDQAIALTQLTGLFGAAAGARLAPRPAAPQSVPRAKQNESATQATSAQPRRNPATGKIES